MSNFWFNLIGWILGAILITGAIIFAVGYEAPHKGKDDNTVNYDALKWTGVGLLIFGGVGMLMWLYFKLRKTPFKFGKRSFKPSVVSSEFRTSNMGESRSMYEGRNLYDESGNREYWNGNY